MTFNRFKPENSFLDRIYRINKSGFRKRRTPQNDPIGFALNHSPSVLYVSFDSLRSLLRSCLRQSISLWSAVGNSAGFGFRQDALIETGCSVPSLHSKGLFALLSEGELGRGNFEDLVRDTGLSGRVVFEGEVFDQILCVVGGALHRDHSSALL